MLVTVDEAVGNKERKLEPMACRAVPLIIVPVLNSSLATQQQQHEYRSAPCVGPKCMHWCWQSSTPPNQEPRGFCGLSGP
jgi:hypothetical protein